MRLDFRIDNDVSKLCKHLGSEVYTPLAVQIRRKARQRKFFRTLPSPDPVKERKDLPRFHTMQPQRMTELNRR